MTPTKELRERLYRFLEPSPPDENWWEKSFDGFILAMIVFSAGAVILRTMQTLPESFSSLLVGFQVFATGVFTVEYLLRVYSCTADESYSHPVWGRIKFILTPMAIVDLVAIVPYVLVSLVASEANEAAAALMLRMLRLLKLFRYSHSLTVFARVLRQKADQLIAAFFVTGVLLVFSSSLVYFAERGAQPEAFPSIPATMWWGIVTLTTVGYGDISPVTPLGQLFGAITAVVGIGIVALPSGILASGFIEEFAQEEQAQETREVASEEQCPHCGHPL